MSKATRSPVAKAIWIGILIVVALNLAILGIDSATGGPGGPGGSSFSTGPDGLNAYSELLTRNGFEVTASRDRISSSTFSPEGTVVVLDPNEVTDEDTERLRTFLEGGGRLLAGGASPGWIDDLMDGAPSWAPFQVARSEPLVPVPEVAGVRNIVSQGFGSWVEPRSALPIAGDGTNTLAVIAPVGEGRLVLLADSAPLQNRLLSEADNAAFGIGLAGPNDRTVTFVESVHGYGSSTGLGALPTRWKVAGFVLALGTILLIAAHIRRLGAPEAADRDLPPGRKDYVEAVAATLARTRRPDEAAAAVKSEARRLIACAAGLPIDAPAADMQRAAIDLGVPPEEARAATETVRSDRELVLAGRCLARLGSAGEGGST